jgi:predicted MFS family arabinose efflux permease
MQLGYKSLFLIDGLTCIIAILIFTILVKEKKKPKDLTAEPVAPRSRVIRDRPFWVFLITCVITGILFFQLFTTLPLYQKEQFNLTEFQTGLLMTLNGFLVFFFEMPIVAMVEKKHINKAKMVALGCFGMAISVGLLLFNFWAGILIFVMVIFSFAEMFAFPFSNAFALSRAPKGQEGRYMAVFTMSYSLAHILSGEIGMNMVQVYGYQANWFFMMSLGFVGTILGIWVLNTTRKE